MKKFNCKWDCNNADYSSQFISSSGSGLVSELKVKVDLEGVDVAVEKGTHDLYSEIQSYKDDTDLKKVMDMLGVSPSDNGITVTDEVIDLTRIPSTLGDWNNYSRELDEFWNSLDVHVRADMDNNIHNLPDYLDAVVNSQFVESYNKANPDNTIDTIETAPAVVENGGGEDGN